ncbi:MULTISPECIES: glycosyltransferase family 4 protein [Streptomyces]|uniref:Alpha-D-kanosaminyltransferase n=1 Tax=Streptomyces rubrolavendulae TaxID=285473 RepID=A0A1D8FYC9_9ACTN|nr:MULTISPECIES: glycosyltransferase family 4 protein [Streptomyces]AOT58202.1 Alpha-D-kanosaminyltransferase [Streptomyces rubrolavendulae]UQS28786.1 glycosyltransferase family 4 protein [Streptomyces fradiae]
MTQLRTVQVLGGGGAGSSAHVRSLAAGLVARGVRVTVCAPAELDRTHDFLGAGAHVVPMPPRNDPLTVGALRAVCAGADVVHAHGLNAGVRSALALAAHRVPLVVTWHTRPHAEGARGHVLRLMERKAARAADVVLATSSELVDRARRRGARDARLGAVTLPPPSGLGDLPGEKARAELGAVGRPLVVTAGPLEPYRGYGALLDASRRWLGHDPVPLVAVAGDGPRRAALQRRVDTEGLPVRLLGARGDVAQLLAAADVAVLAGRWEARAPLAQAALRLGVPLVATAVGGVPELVGDAAELVPYGDSVRLAAAVSRLLADPARHAELAAAGPRQAATWPTEEETIAQVLSVYDELRAGRGRHLPDW